MAMGYPESSSTRETHTLYPKNPSSSSRKLQPQIHRIKMEVTIRNNKKKLKFLCLHGIGMSAEILKKQIGLWPDSVLGRLDLYFLDGPQLATGKSRLDRFYKPPYYQWYHCNKESWEYYHFEECIAYIEDYMIKHGPFDGLLGFSQGGILSGALLGMQMQGVAFQKVPKIKSVIIISGIRMVGVKFGQPKLAANAYSSRFLCPSLHIIGEKDFLKEGANEFLASFEDPFVIHHCEGHTIPRLEGKNLETMLNFIDKIEKLMFQEKQISAL